MPYVPMPQRPRHNSQTGYYDTGSIADDMGELLKDATIGAIKAPKRFWDYLRTDIGKEHAEEEEAKRQAILKHQKK